MFVKRVFDLLFSILLLILLSPVLLLVSILILTESNGPVMFKQVRVGLNNKDFYIYKFRTMYQGSEVKGQLTVGNDSRITGTGRFLRKYKIDELPQLVNVLFGTMSFVGPRPEVRKYVELYSIEQQKVLSVKPGITDPASIAYSNENELLSQAVDPEKEYVQHIMQAKLLLNMEYVKHQSFLYDLKIILKTVRKIISH